MGSTKIKRGSRYRKFDHGLILRIALIVFVSAFAVLAIYDFAAGVRHYDSALIKDSDYTPERRTCDSKGSCSTRSESCRVYVRGDMYEGWSDMDCFYFHRYARLNDLVNVTWVEGKLSGMVWFAKVVR